MLTSLALLLVWVALVAPNEPQPAHARRVPAASRSRACSSSRWPCSCPRTARRVLAWVVGPVLGVLLLVKVLDIGFFTAFDRPFNPVDDSATPTSASRRCATRSAGRPPTWPSPAWRCSSSPCSSLPDPGGAAPDPGRRRPPPALAPGRRGARRSPGCSAGRSARSSSPARPSPPRAPPTWPSHEVQAVQDGLRGRLGFAARDPPRPLPPTPGDRLLTDLRGKDVLLVFVESYGKVAVEGSSFSPRVDARPRRRARSSCRPPASPRAAAGSRRRPSAASAGWRTPRCSRGSGSTPRGGTTSSWGATASRSARPSSAPAGGPSTMVPSNDRDLGRGVVVLPLRPGLRPAQRRATAARSSRTPPMPDQYVLRGPAAARARASPTARRCSPRSTWCRATRRGPASRR